MSTQPETRLQQRIQKRLKKEVGGWWFKVHGGPFQAAGIPDLIGCVEGLFFGFEVKTATGAPSEIQIFTLRAIRQKGGAVAKIVRTPEAAVAHVRKAIGNRRLPHDVNKKGCWEFKGHRNEQGYGRLRWRGVLWRAHRLAYTLFVKPIPEGHDVLHTCDNTCCINPDHLFTGTDADNVRDRERKGRGVRVTGEKHWKTKLTPKDVRDIRRRRKAKETARSIGKDYGLTVSGVSAIVKKRSWAHVR